MVTRAAALALAVALASCGPRADDYPLLRPEATYPSADPFQPPAPEDVNVIEHDPLEPWDETGAGPLTGIFAVEVVAKMKAIVDVEVRQLYRVRLLQRDAAIRVKMQLCRLTPPKVAGVAELIAPAALEALLRAKPIENEGKYLDGTAFTPPPFALDLGVASADDDKDGNPGVTLHAKVLMCDREESIYATLRTGATLHGTVAGDAIHGGADPLLDQKVLGTSNPCLGAAASLTITAEPGSSFSAKRATAALDIDKNGNVTCGEIVAAAGTFFAK